jgi:hypothetical protein
VGVAFHIAEGGLYFASLIPYLAVLCFLFPSGKKPLAIALGIAAATGLLGGGLSMVVLAAPLPIAAVLCFLLRRGKNPLAFALGMATATGFLGSLVAFRPAAPLSFATMWIWILLSDVSAWLPWAFFVSSLMLGLSACGVFYKMRFEAKGTRWISFGSGVFTAVLVLFLSLILSFIMGLTNVHM